jgi:DNA-binding MarR family transcriptional regulator
MGESLGVAAGLVRLSFLVQSVYAEVSARYGLTVPHAQLLCVVKDKPRGMTELAEMLRLEKSSLSGLVDRVERRALVRRTVSPLDRRAVSVETTPEGKSIVDAFYDEVSDRLLSIVSDLSAADRERFARLATRIVFAESVPAVFGDVPAPAGPSGRT